MKRYYLIIFALVIFFLTTRPLLAEEKDLYNFLWLDPDKSVYVLQNKLYKKKHTIYGDVGYLIGMTSPFQSTEGVKFKTGFYFNEVLAVELFYTIYSNTNNSTIETIKHLNGSIPFIIRIENTYGANLVWSPFYGKINTFNKIFYFDWSFGLGLGEIVAETNRDKIDVTSAPIVYNEETLLGVNLNTVIRLHITTHWHVGLGVVSWYYSAYGPYKSEGKSLRNNLDTMFSLGFSF